MQRSLIALATLGLLACDAPREADEPATPSALPALSGGTLAVSTDGALAVAADPDRGAVYIVDLKARALRHTVAAPGEPGRVALSADTAFVALRRGGAVLAVDLASGSSRHLEACPAPRGLALDTSSSETGALHVACADGTLDTLDATTGERTRRVFLDTDLRDVVVVDGVVHVSRFRSAELLTLDRAGTVVRRVRPEPRDDAAPVVAWRTVATAEGEVAMLHQRASLRPVRAAQPGGYGTSQHGCGSVVGGQVTVFDVEGAPRTALRIAAALTVDLAPHGERLGLANPGAPTGNERSRVSLLDAVTGDRCVAPHLQGGQDPTLPARQVTAVARAGDGTLYAFSREPAALLDGLGAELVELSSTSAADRSHDLFHHDAGRGIACASCHPEAGDDGHVWLFAGQGLRRTQHLAGGLKGSAPFHWAGDMTDFGTLMSEVRERRMGGETLEPRDAGALLDWLDAQPAPPAPELNAAAVARGRDAFEAAGCASCHAGPLLTDNRAHDVGTGRTLQTPALRGLAYRNGFMHDGCAPELADRFDPTCGGHAHGAVDILSSAQLGDLVEYLRSL